MAPTEVLEEHLERIAALDGRLGAFRLLRTDEVRDVLLSPALALPPLPVGAYRARAWPGRCSA